MTKGIVIRSWRTEIRISGGISSRTPLGTIYISTSFECIIWPLHPGPEPAWAWVFLRMAIWAVTTDASGWLIVCRWMTTKWQRESGAPRLCFCQTRLPNCYYSLWLPKNRYMHGRTLQNVPATTYKLQWDHFRWGRYYTGRWAAVHFPSDCSKMNIFCQCDDRTFHGMRSPWIYYNL